MNITRIYIYLMYVIVISCVIAFILQGTKEHYIIASLLFLGNILPGYAMTASMMEKNEN